jgi:hypothetical protein
MKKINSNMKIKYIMNQQNEKSMLANGKKKNKKNGDIQILKMRRERK